MVVGDCGQATRRQTDRSAPVHAFVAGAFSRSHEYTSESPEISRQLTCPVTSSALPVHRPDHSLPIMVALWGLLAHLVALAALVTAKSSTGDSVLVVLEPSLKREDYSTFFGGLESMHVISYTRTGAYRRVLRKRIQLDLPRAEGRVACHYPGRYRVLLPRHPFRSRHQE